MIGLEILILIVLNKFGRHSILFRKLINTNQYNYFYTIKELEKIGYSFIRYKNESERTFPDADFYFSYLHVMSSAMIRESIVNFFKEDATKSFIREYSGDLFDNDLGILKYDLNKIVNIILEIIHSLLKRKSKTVQYLINKHSKEPYY